jgi:probable rRNA maturation factor
VIHLRDDVGAPELSARRLKTTAQKLLNATDRGGAELSILLTGDDDIRELNRTHRGKDKATDVLSFPGNVLRQTQDDKVFLGDIAISVDTARRQAAEYDAPLQNEINRLLIHGLLHVLGHDHHEPAERAAMEAEERRLASAIAMPWPYD